MSAVGDSTSDGRVGSCLLGQCCGRGVLLLADPTRLRVADALDQQVRQDVMIDVVKASPDRPRTGPEFAASTARVIRCSASVGCRFAWQTQDSFRYQVPQNLACPASDGQATREEIVVHRYGFGAGQCRFARDP